ncbi:UDP-glycosyltransferase 89B2-like [Alnus glutinosa]|uniref:UDP-glycosyltransferase 89B2-like n=1 Tax=Alnus glutinosa TaxID=3517 RepID=UPI002D779C51|nr:UDP-glycosyltransferase 89B2-like [Alnus glutinosa]
MSSTTAGPHILAYPYPDSGHIIPLLDLIHRLLARGLTVTVLINPDNLPLLHPLLSIHPSSIQPLVLSAPEVHDPPRKTRVAKVRAMSELYYPILLQWFRSHPSPPVAIISDYFLGWTHHLACELGVRRLVFSPSGAFGFSVLSSVWRDLPKPIDPNDMGSPISFPKIPHSPDFPWRQISRHYRNGKEGDPDWELFRSDMLDDIASWGIVFNSFAELERVYLQHLRAELGHDRVWAVGPLLPPEDSLIGLAKRGGSSSLPCHEVMTWLGARHDNSVVYVCFGSRTSLTRKQMDVLVDALEHSRVQFILCVGVGRGRHVGDDVGAIPEGFEDRVEGRGLVIKGWAPQVAILRHRAVGAFLTHCGWNSVLEGLDAGVVMLTWPMGADQFTNAKLLVEQLGVGIRAGEDMENIPESTELSRLLAESVNATRPERVRVKKLSDAALGAIKGGSSDKDLDELVKRLAAR